MGQRARLGTVPEKYDQRTFGNILEKVENRLNRLENPVRSYEVTGLGADVRSIDVSTATLADVADFVATLVMDLQAAGKLGKA